MSSKKTKRFKKSKQHIQGIEKRKKKPTRIRPGFLMDVRPPTGGHFARIFPGEASYTTR